MDFIARQYQLAARDATLDDLLNKRLKKVANILPTGSGKTEIMAMTAEAYIKAKPDSGIMILSHLRDLTDQSFERFRLRAPRLSLGLLQGKDKPTLMNQVVISTMQTARNKKSIDTLKDNMARNIDLIMVDETHMLPTNSYQLIQNQFPNAQLVGYTATPFRERKIMTGYFDNISFTISLQELIDQGYLVKPTLREFCIQDGLEEHAELMAVASLYQQFEKGKKSVIYLRTINDAKLLRNVFETIGVKSRAVTSDVPSASRKEIYDEFKNGSLDVLVTVDVLTAGFDAPCISSIFMPYGTKSPTQYLQRVGRGLRPYPGKAECNVYMFGNTPTVSNKVYEKINKVALNAGRKEPAFNTYKEDLELTFYPEGCEIYSWTKAVVDVVKKMDRIGMHNFAKLLNDKQFPPNFMNSIHELIRRLPQKKITRPNGDKPATDSQKSVLFEAGFDSGTISGLSLNEASMMIHTIMNKHNDPSGKAKEFILPDGNYKGRHVSELPYKYRTLVKKQFPGSAAAELITAWETRKRRA